MQATQDLFLYAHTFFFFSNFLISWFLVRKFMSLNLLMLTDERKWAFMAFALFCGIAAGVIDIAADPSNLGGLAWLQAGALLLMSLMNTFMIWVITVPLDASARPLPGYLRLRPSFITLFYDEVGILEKTSDRMRALWRQFIQDQPQTYYLWYVYAVPIKDKWDLRVLPVDYPEEQWSQKDALGFFVGVLALKHPGLLKPWYEVFKARTNRDLPKLSDIPFRNFERKAVSNPTAEERRVLAKQLVKNIRQAIPQSACLTPIL